MQRWAHPKLHVRSVMPASRSHGPLPLSLSSPGLIPCSRVPLSKPQVPACGVCGTCRWGGPDAQVPVVRFLNGRELPISPELFTAEVAAIGTCKRTQVEREGLNCVVAFALSPPAAHVRLRLLLCPYVLAAVAIPVLRACPHRRCPSSWPGPSPCTVSAACAGWHSLAWRRGPQHTRAMLYGAVLSPATQLSTSALAAQPWLGMWLCPRCTHTVINHNNNSHPTPCRVPGPDPGPGPGEPEGHVCGGAGLRGALPGAVP